MSRLPTIEIREARAEEIEVAAAFYEENQDEHVMPRKIEVLERAREDGTLFCATLVSAPDGFRRDRFGDGDWIAVSGAYRVDDPDRSLFETGGSIVAKPFRGLWVHKSLHAARILTVRVMQAGSYDDLFGAIIAPNDPSKRNLLFSGFEVWANPPRQLEADRAPYAKEPGSSIEYFRFPDRGLQSLAQRLLKIDRSGFIDRGPEKEPVPAILDLRILKSDVRGDIEEIAGQNKLDGESLG